MKTVIDAVNELKGVLPTYIHNEQTNLFFDCDSYLLLHSMTHKGNYEFICNVGEFNQCVEEMTNMNIKPIYTQAMVDAGVMPSVGMECLINFPDIDNAWYEYTIDFMGKHTFIASCEDVSERFGHIEDVHIKPLTPPIELIDGKAYQFSVNGNEPIHGIYNRLSNGFYHIAILYGLKSCTSIQLLEVKNNDD